MPGTAPRIAVRNTNRSDKRSVLTAFPKSWEERVRPTRTKISRQRDVALCYEEKEQDAIRIKEKSYQFDWRMDLGTVSDKT